MSGFDAGPPAADEYAEYHVNYVSLVPAGPILETLKTQGESTLRLFDGLSDADAEGKQTPYAWSIKQVIGHMSDTERVFAYRALRIARGDATPLPGFEQDDYAREAHSDAIPLADLLAEYRAIREATLWLFRGLDTSAWMRVGTVNGHRLGVRALAHIIAGHERHHAVILRRRVNGGGT